MSESFKKHVGPKHRDALFLLFDVAAVAALAMLGLLSLTLRGPMCGQVGLPATPLAVHELVERLGSSARPSTIHASWLHLQYGDLSAHLCHPHELCLGLFYVFQVTNTARGHMVQSQRLFCAVGGVSAVGEAGPSCRSSSSSHWLSRPKIERPSWRWRSS